MRPTWGQVRQFCGKQGYKETRTNHFHYLKLLVDHSTSGTMVPLGVDGDEVPAQMWGMVWCRQLRLVAEEEFWKGLRGEKVTYTLASQPEAAAPLPAYLTRFLKDTLRFTDAQIAATTREEVQQRLNEYYATELRKE